MNHVRKFPCFVLTFCTLGAISGCGSAPATGVPQLPLKPDTQGQTTAGESRTQTVTVAEVPNEPEDSSQTYQTQQFIGQTMTVIEDGVQVLYRWTGIQWVRIIDPASYAGVVPVVGGIWGGGAWYGRPHRHGHHRPHPMPRHGGVRGGGHRR